MAIRHRIWINAVVAALGACIFAAVVALETKVIPSTEMLPVFAAVTLFCGMVGAISHIDPFLRQEHRAAWIFSLLAMLVLAASSALYLQHLHASIPSSSGYAWEGEHLGELAKLSREHRYWMDGSMDEWLYVLFNQGLSTIPYRQIPVIEKGLLYFYASVLTVAGDFNTYLLLVVNCAAQVLSAWLLLRVAFDFVPARAAFGAAALLMVMPDALYWGSLLHKDNIVLCILLLQLWSGIRAHAGSSLSPSHAALFAISMVGLAFTRAGLVLPVISGGLLAIALMRRSFFRRTTQYGTSLLVAMTLVSALLPLDVSTDLRNRTFDRVYYRLVEGSSYKLDVENIRFTTTAADSLIHRLSGGDLNWRKFHFVPIRVAMYFVAPFPPWPVRTTVDGFVLPSAWILVPLWFFFLRGCWKGIRQDSAVTMWMLSYFIVLGIAVAFAGAFIHERYRVLLMPFFLTFASFGEIVSTRKQKLGCLLGSLCSFLIGLTIYWTLR